MRRQLPTNALRISFSLPFLTVLLRTFTIPTSFRHFSPSAVMRAYLGVLRHQSGHILSVVLCLQQACCKLVYICFRVELSGFGGLT